MQEWYERALGFTSEFAFAPMPDLRIAMLVHPSGARLELFERAGSNESPIPPDPLARAVAPRADALEPVRGRSRRDVRTAGPRRRLERVGPALAELGVRMAFVADPEGHLIELLER